MKNNSRNIPQLYYNAASDLKWWAYAGWTLPFIALAILIVEKLFGLESLYKNTVLLTLFIFFTISVYWWWWALDTILRILHQLNGAETRIVEIKQDLKETRLIIRRDHAGNR